MKSWLTVVVVVGAMLVPAAPGGAAEEPIKLGAIFDQSGPTADSGTPWSEGVRDYVSWHNARPDRGKTVALSWQDFGYKPELAGQLYSQFVNDGVVGFLGWASADTEALRPRANADQIPFMSGSYPETLTDPEQTPYNFVDGTTYSDQLRVTLQWIAKQAGGKHTEVAVLHHDGPFGTSPLEDGRKYIAERNLDLGYKTYPMPKGATDYNAELEQAKAQGAAYVIVHNVTSPAAKVARNLADGKYGMKMVCLNWCGDEQLVKLAGPAAEGVAAVMPFAPPSADADGMQAMKEYLADQGEKLEDKGVHYVQGWYTMAAMVTAAVAASEAKGSAIKQQLESSEGVDTGGVATGPIRFTADSHKGMKGARLFQVKEGRWQSLTEALTP